MDMACLFVRYDDQKRILQYKAMHARGKIDVEHALVAIKEGWAILATTPTGTVRRRYRREWYLEEELQTGWSLIDPMNKGHRIIRASLWFNDTRPLKSTRQLSG
ncbi:hypothetical protein Tco_0637402 [Tanacetum coccineum]